MTDRRIIESILDLGRWAPSGDNTQPWRFQIVDGSRVVVYGFDTRDHCVYDLDGHPSQVSLGALLETIAIAATAHGLHTGAARRPDTAETRPTFDLTFATDQRIRPDPLIEHITTRSVQRRLMQTRLLAPSEKQMLEASVGPAHHVAWLEGPAAKWKTARLMFANAKLRLTMPEAYVVHRDVIEWGARNSADRVPDQALGVDPLTARLMQWIMQDWRRVEFFNRYLAGTVAPRIQMDLLPGLFCAGHFVLSANELAQSIDHYVAAGRAMQRFWLTATQLGHVMQPELTPLIFGRYVREGVAFSATRALHDQARALLLRLEALVGERESRLAVFMGRIGAGSAPTARSTRRPLADLMVTGQP